MRKKSRSGRGGRLLPEQRKRGSSIFRCRFCGRLIRRGKETALLCEADKTCACPSCLTRLGLNTPPSTASLLADMGKGVRHV